MSKSIYWEPIGKNERNISLSCPSSFIEMFEEIFECCPIILKNDDIRILKGIQLASEQEDVKTEIERLIKAIGKFNKIRIDYYT